jgi:hypothetical protein
MTMRIFLFLVLALIVQATPAAESGWFCKEGASERISNTILACGIARARDEDEARKAALRNAFDELDLVCDRSADCRRFNLNIEPKRNECLRETDGYKCYRAVQAIITDEKRSEDFRRGQSLKADMARLDTPTPVAKPGCPFDAAPVEAALRDLSDPGKVEAVAALAVRIPFSGECAAIHYKVLSRLERFRLVNETYEDFLLKSLEDSTEKGAEDRLYATLQYFRALGPLTDRQWGPVFVALKRANSNYNYRLLPPVFSAASPTAEVREKQRQRLDQLLGAAKAASLGRPVPLEFDKAFAAVLRAVNDADRKHNAWLTLHACEKYFGGLNGSQHKAIHQSLFSAYKQSGADDEKQQLLTWLVANTNGAPAGQELSRSAIDVLDWFNREIGKLDPEEAADRAKGKVLRRDRDAYKLGARAKLEETLGQVRDKHETKQRVLFCAQNGIACRNIMPSLDDYRHLLGSKQEKKRRDALDMLKTQPEIARQLDAEITQTLLDSRDRRYSFSAMLIRQSVDVLVDMPTGNPRALDAILAAMLDGFTNYEAILGKIGAKLVTRIMNVVADRTSRHRLLAIQFLGIIGPDAKAAIGLLEGELRRDNHYSIRDAAQDSLRKIRS